MSEAGIVYRCTPRQTREFMLDVLEAGLTPFVRSSPGMGKSSITHSIAKDAKLKMIDHRLTTSAPEDLTGLPEFYTDANGNRRAHFVPFGDLFPIEGDTVPDGYSGWMVFLDEFPSASKAIQAAAYKLILDRMVGQHKLHERVVLAAAGNLATDRAIVNELSTAMQSRLVHIEMELNHKEWMEDVAIKNNYDPRLVAYLSQFPEKLMDFDPAHQDRTFCCPRTWEFMNRLIKGKQVTASKAGLYAGAITSGIATEFVTYCEIWKDVIPMPEIINDPEKCRLPAQNNLKWMTITSMLEHVDENVIGPMSQYASRFDLTFQILFWRSIMVRFGDKFRHRPEFVKGVSSVGRYLA